MPSPQEVVLDAAKGTVKVSGGISYGALGRALEEQGYAIHNLASLPHISVAGAIQTGTHGSGVNNPSLAAAVVSVDLVRASGELVTLRPDDDEFLASVVGMGALGIVTGWSSLSGRAMRYDSACSPTCPGRAHWRTSRPSLRVLTVSVSSPITPATPFPPRFGSRHWTLKLRCLTCLGQPLQRLPCIPCRTCPRRTAPSSWMWPASGLTVCRTSATNSRPATARSCKASCSCRWNRRRPRCRLSGGDWPTSSHRSCSSPKSAPWPLMSSG